MSSTIQIDGLADAVMKELRGYTAKVAQATKQATKATGRFTTREIKATAPRRTGKYAESWRSKTVSESSDKLALIVHSPKKYMLTHLLEYGHAKRGGGRVRAIPHLAPAEEKAGANLENEIRKRVERL